MGVKEYKFAGDDRHLLNEYHRQLDSLGDWIIQFDAFDKQDYGFDKVSNKKGIFSGSEYYPYLSANYDLRYKSVETSNSDKVIVDFGSYPKDSVIFKDKYGVKLKFTDKNILTFTGTNQADTNYIYAYHGDQKIGKLMLNVYKRKPIKVCLVMVNGAHHKESFSEIQKHLNKVFKPAVVEFEITHADFKMSELTSFSHGGSPWNSVYNDDQKRVLRAYNDSIKDGVYYLFFIDNVTDKKDGNGTMVSGYMPRGYNCGFVYDGGSPHTIAHELGHGIAGLEHVFENSKSSGKTQNLMDYASGEELWHFQWDAIQDPSRVWMKWNKDESEGEGLIDAALVAILWSCIPYTERKSKQERDLLLKPRPNGYEKIYEKHTECGKLQEGYASESHKDSFDVIFNKLPEKYQKDKYVLDKFEFFKKLTEEQVLNIYKTGYKSYFDKVNDYFYLFDLYKSCDHSIIGEVIRRYRGKELTFIGSNDVLSDELQNYVYLAFESKTKCPITLNCLESSKQSQDLHVHYLFQKEYYVPNFIYFIYKNLDNVDNLDNILDKNNLPNSDKFILCVKLTIFLIFLLLNLYII